MERETIKPIKLSIDDAREFFRIVLDKVAFGQIEQVPLLLRLFDELSSQTGVEPAIGKLGIVNFDGIRPYVVIYLQHQARGLRQRVEELHPVTFAGRYLLFEYGSPFVQLRKVLRDRKISPTELGLRNGEWEKWVNQRYDHLKNRGRFYGAGWLASNSDKYDRDDYPDLFVGEQVA